MSELPDPSILTRELIKEAIAGLKEVYDTRLEAMDKAQLLFETNLTRVPTDVDKSIGHLRNLVMEKFGAIEASIGNRQLAITERFDGMDKAQKLFQIIADQVMARVDEKLNGLELVQQEKFSSIQNQFKERDERAIQAAKSAQEALGAALLTAEKASLKQTDVFKESIAKSEAAIGKVIDGLVSTVAQGNKTADEKIDDLKERMTQNEGVSRGGHMERVDHRANTSIGISQFGLIITVGVILVGIVLWLVAQKSQPQVTYIPLNPQTSVSK